MDAALVSGPSYALVVGSKVDMYMYIHVYHHITSTQKG